MLSASQHRSNPKYGTPDPNPGSEFARDAYQGPTKVRPFAKETSSTKAKAMAWDNPQAGGSSFLKFDDAPQMSQPGA
jgi:hypothetical protein